MSRILTVFAVFFFFCAKAQDVTPLSIEFETFASGFTDPVGIYHAGDDRLFVIEQSTGEIIVLDASGATLGTFLDIGNLISTGSERGLLGLAFHPQYASNGQFFVNYTNGAGDTVIARYEVSGNPNQADASSAQILLTIDQPFGNHNGGHIAFGPDGYLYIGLGDGGSQGDPLNNSQNGASLLGKMLRIDIDGGSPYSIPADNPFVGDAGVADEIWAFGLRNPWKFSFDRQTGDLWIGDVGQNEWEEINFQPAASSGGENYGWRCYEGPDSYNTSGCASQNNYDFPVAAVTHSNPDNWCSVTGGIVYRGSQFPAMQGKYFFTDYCVGAFYTLTQDGGGGFSQELVTGNAGFGYVAFGEDVNGELYAVRINGTISRIVDSCGPFDPQLAATSNGLEATEGVGYTWYQNGEEVMGETSAVYSPTASGSIYALVENAEGCVRQTNTVEWTIIGGIAGCTYQDAENYNANATVDDGSCSFIVQSCPGDFDNNQLVNVEDLLVFLQAYGNGCD
jgi:glucose/arabinose dehydrogenase